MSIQIEIENDSRVTVCLTGKLHQPELAAVQRKLIEQLTGGAKTAILVDAREFDGWASDGDWGELDEQYQMDPLILKMAVVAEPKWETLAYAFTGKGIRKFPIELFAPADFEKAVAWLAEA